MGYKVALSPSARRDLRDIVRYISLDSPDRAVTFGQFLLSSTKHLADFPEMGRVVPEFDDPSIREIVVRSYRVIHRVDHSDCRVDIARFWHAARGIPKTEDAT
jgi:toxin ParE1/3/4